MRETGPQGQQPGCTAGRRGLAGSHTAGPGTESTGSWEQLDSWLPAPALSLGQKLSRYQV